MVYEYVGTVLVRFGTAIVDVCLVVVDDIVVVVVNCVGIDRCTKVFPTLPAAKFHASSEYRSVSRALV